MGTQAFVDRFYGGSHAVYGKHIEGGPPYHTFIMGLYSGDQAAVTKFRSPACQAAFNKIIVHVVIMGRIE